MRKCVRYAMLFTVLAWPVLSVAMGLLMYNMQLGTRYGVVTGGDGMELHDKLYPLRPWVHRHTVIIELVLGFASMFFVVLSFCLVVEGLLLFAMKDDKV